MAYITNNVKSKAKQYGLEAKDISKMQKTASQMGAFYRKVQALTPVQKEEIGIESEETREI